MIASSATATWRSPESARRPNQSRYQPRLTLRLGCCRRFTDLDRLAEVEENVAERLAVHLLPRG
eukprot:16438451-Heterocapsa_arctica.AAC.1